MKTRTSTKMTIGAAIVMGWTWLTALQCLDVTSPPSIQGCSVSYDTNFPTDGSISLNKPAKCPVRLLGNTFIPYAATADLPAGSVAYQFYQNEIITWNGYHSGFVANHVWSQGNGRYFVNITGDYVAARGGFDLDNTGWDDIRNGFNKGFWTYATTRVTYTYGFPTNSIDAPTNVELNQQYFVQATTNDPLMVSPVSWSWYVDGQFVGTTSQNSTNLYSANQNTLQEVQVVATDGNGHSASGQTTVIVGTGCNPQIQC